MIKPPTDNFILHSHCSWCGTRFLEQASWPRRCSICWNESYKNPIPVVVSLIAIYDHARNEYGLLIQKRNIEPKKGEWALPSGYINFGETWEEAAARENKEEMEIVSSPKDYSFFDIKTATNYNIVIFATHCSLESKPLESYLKNFVPNEEVSEVGILYSDSNIELAFPTHIECAKQYLKELNLEV